jgi:DNA-binding NarL/FixJ family response regulator
LLAIAGNQQLAFGALWPYVHTHGGTNVFRKRVIIVDDHAAYRNGLRKLLSDRFDVVAEASEGGEAVDRTLAYKPDVVIMDISLPGMDGIAATRKIKEQLCGTQVVILSGSDDDLQVFEAIKAGVSGYVLKDEPAKTLVEAVTSACEGNGYLPPTLVKRVFAGVGGTKQIGEQSAALSNREMDVLRLMAQGKRNQEIAEALCISDRTVGNHITGIYKKLGLYDRAQVIVYAIRRGVVRV